MEWILRNSSRSRKSRQAFSPEEDEALKKAVELHGETNWTTVACCLPHRNARQCRERWRCYLRPDLTNKQWTQEEDAIIIEKFKELGPKWTAISHYLPNRSEINIKARFKLLEKCFLAQTTPSNFCYPVIINSCGFQEHYHMDNSAQQGMDSSNASLNKSSSSDSSPESSAPDKESVNSQQDLEAFFNSLSIDHIKNTPKINNICNDRI